MSMNRAALVLAIAAPALGCEPTVRAAYLRTPDDAGGSVENADDAVRFRSSVCEGENLTPQFDRLTAEDLESFLTQKGFKTRSTRARGDLVYIDVLGQGEDFVRLRVAILSDAPAAGRELHEAILQHGPGSWGVHRSNLAVLAPIGTNSQIYGFAAKSKLVCWGVLTLAGLDDTFVIPGGYMEL
jgi:hypothetical protein